MSFVVGEKVVVPTLGVGVVKELEKLSISGAIYEFYVIKVLENGSTYKVPVDKIAENKIRNVMTLDTIDQVYEILRDRDTPADKQTWNRRYREYMNKIKTGNPIEIARVLRDLAILRAEKTLSFGERKMYDQAHSLIVQEIAVARDVDEEQVKNELESLFSEADAAAESAGKLTRKKKKPAEVLDDEEDEDDEDDDDDE